MSEIEREFIPSLREGIDVVKMIFFKQMKEHLQKKFSDEESSYSGMLTGAILNQLFLTPNTQEKFVRFVADNNSIIEQELHNISSQFKELCPLLTDTLRMHFLCSHQEGLDDTNGELLKKAKQYGILIEEREVPLPKGFMEFVYRVGKGYGLIIEQNPFYSS